MSRNMKITIGIVACALMLMVGVTLALSDLFRVRFGPSEGYSEGGAVIRDEIDSLDIDWTSGKVNVIYHQGDAFEISEQADKPIPENQRMCWQLDGKTLKVRFSRPGLKIFSSQEKELTVKIPEHAVLAQVRIGATSGELLLPEIHAEKLELDVTSGLIQASADARKIEVGVTSGNVKLKLLKEADEVNLNASSGSVLLEAEKADSIRASSTSGGIRISVEDVRKLKIGTTSGSVVAEAGHAEKTEINSTSGAVQAFFHSLKSLEVDSTSGNVTVKLPDQPGFTARLETSGTVDYGMALSRQGKKYVCGDGSAEVDIECTSGNIRLDAAGE